MKTIEHIYPSWCVKNDGSQLFKDTVIKYINTNFININYSGGIINSYYGIDKCNLPLSNENVNNFEEELTLNEFIKLTEIKMKYFKLNQTVYHPIEDEGIITKIDLSLRYPIIVEFKNKSVLSFTEDGRYKERGKILLSQNPILEIVNKPLEDEYVPFTFEDRELLKGKWIKTKGGGNWEGMIVFVNQTKIGVDAGVYYSYNELFENYEFVDGKPCGKLVN